jgi:hypothetical protein
VAQIAASIKEFGFTNPVLTHGDDILAGHGRVLAARKLGMATVPSIDLSHLTKTQARAYILADNQLSLNAGWEAEMLALELAELNADGFDLDLLGFPDVAGLMNPEPEGGLAPGVDEDAVPEPPKVPITKPGDIITLGRHRLMCGDSTNPQHVDELLDGAKVEIVLTDPPYGIGYEYSDHKDDDKDANAQLVSDVFSLHECGKVWTPGLMNLARDITRFGKCKVAVWYKKFAQAGSGIGGASTWEPILVLDPPVKALGNDVIVLMTDREEVGGVNLRELHSCPKPVGLYSILLDAFTTSKGNVFEPFCGSGTTLIASEKTGRTCYGMEISPIYCDVIVARWEQATGQKAVRP